MNTYPQNVLLEPNERCFVVSCVQACQVSELQALLLEARETAKRAQQELALERQSHRDNSSLALTQVRSHTQTHTPAHTLIHTPRKLDRNMNCRLFLCAYVCVCVCV